jgi:NhaA family Na+:H+ antiporter
MKRIFNSPILQGETAGGIILFFMALAAFILSNSPLSGWYAHIWQIVIGVNINGFALSQPFLFWVNEGLMALFFLLVGLELKREFLGGELSRLSQVILPGTAALGGMVAPAVIYCLFNWHNADAISGWAIPVATDIAFALGVLSLFGKRVPPGLKVFLLALAIFDDLGAIVIIALSHLESLSCLSLFLAFLCLVLLWLLNLKGVQSLTLYLLVGLLLWLCVLHSGVHATVAGVLLAFFIPRKINSTGHSPLQRLEKKLHAIVTYFVMPLFAFANAGVSLSGLNSHILLDNVVLGTALGLFLGKQLGVVLFTWILQQSGLARLPANMGWLDVYGMALLCGIGFTMSLFLATLAFQFNPAYLVEARLGILTGSILSGVMGAAVLHVSLNKKRKGVMP